MNTFNYHADGSPAEPHQIFVFGSNRSGIHGAGAAKAARMFYGAQLGIGEGMTGQSYAIPTVKHGIKGPLTLTEIKSAVIRFIDFANLHTYQEFFVTRIGCGLAGYTDEQIAPFFKNAPTNCSFPITWEPYLEKDYASILRE